MTCSQVYAELMHGPCKVSKFVDSQENVLHLIGLGLAEARHTWRGVMVSLVGFEERKKTMHHRAGLRDGQTSSAYLRRRERNRQRHIAAIEARRAA
jgi:hypothetical protein